MAQDIYTTAGADTWTCPSGVYTIKVECWGGGGSGDQVAGGGAGGGGGAYARLNNYSVVPLQNYDLYVGHGGGWEGDLTNGEDTTFSGSACIADGGLHATGLEGGLGGTTANSTGDVKYSGGAGAGGKSPDDYGGGGGAGDAANGSDSISATGGAGGTAGGGNGGNSGVEGDQPGGGGGGNDAGALNKGGDGKIIITYEFLRRRSYSNAGYYTSSYPAGF